jgi:hypothetical protein
VTAALLLASALSGPPAGAQPPPCASCVRWEVTPAQAARLLEAGDLRGIPLLVPAAASDAALALLSRGAAVAVLLEAEGATPRERAFQVKTEATRVRARDARLRVGIARADEGVADVAAYLDFVVSDPAGVALPGLERWVRTPAGRAADVLAATQQGADMVVVARWPGHGDPGDAPFALARLAPLLGPALAPLAVEVACEPQDPAAGPACDTASYLAGSGDAVVVVRPRAALRGVTLRAGAGAAEPVRSARVHGLEPPYDVRALPAEERGGSTAMAVAGDGAFVLEVEGWARAHGQFGAGVDVVAGRDLTAAEVLARHQAVALRQREAVPRAIASGSLVIAFQSPGLSAPVVVTARITAYVSPQGTEIEQRDLRLNGAPLGGGDVPRLPIVEPERVAAAPLAIALDRTYRYRLEGRETRAGRDCYRVAFEPAAAGASSFRGRAWIEADGFALVRLEAVQTGLRGVIVSSQQADDFAPQLHEGRTVWLPARTTVHQVYEGPGYRTPIDRLLVFDLQEPDPHDFEQRLRAAHAGDAVLLRETARGFEYLRKARAEGSAVAGGAVRVAAGKATAVRTVALGLLVDPNIGDPLPFAGAGYSDVDFLRSGTQLNAFLAGAFAQLSWSAPSLGGSRWRLQAAGLASLVTYNDRVFRRGIEQYAENLRQRPARVALDLSHPLGARWRARAGYELEHVRLQRSDLTAADFREPPSVLAHGLRLALDGQQGPVSASIWWRPARRAQWRAWGFAGAAEEAAGRPTYHRYGVTLARTLIVSTRVSGRLEVAAMAGSGLDRFSRYSFDGFENRLTGYPSASVRYDRGLLARSALTWRAWRGLRLQALADAARVRDAGYGFEARTLVGLGAGLDAALPWRSLLAVEWGYGPQGRDREGATGTHTIRLTAYRVF